MNEINAVFAEIFRYLTIASVAIMGFGALEFAYSFSSQSPETKKQGLMFMISGAMAYGVVKIVAPMIVF